MRDSITVKTNVLNNILTTLSQLKEEVAQLKERLDLEPPYGSDAWWKWSEKKSREEYKKGNYVTLKTEKEIDDFFASI